MPSYLVETYLARGQRDERVARERRGRPAAAELTRGTTPARLDRSIHVPQDEICFFVFDAPTGHDAALAAQRAGLEAIRVVEADLAAECSEAGDETHGGPFCTDDRRGRGPGLDRPRDARKGADERDPLARRAEGRSGLQHRAPSAGGRSDLERQALRRRAAARVPLAAAERGGDEAR